MKGCRELHGLSEYIIIFSKMFNNKNNSLEILCATIYDQADIGIAIRPAVLFYRGTHSLRLPLYNKTGGPIDMPIYYDWSVYGCLYIIRLEDV